MLLINSRTKYEGEIKTLKLTQDPKMYGLGTYTDIDGIQWDVRCYIGAPYSETGIPYINARQITNIPYYSTGTDGHSYGSHEWLPYYYEVIK